MDAKQTIESLGGAAETARKLGFDPAKGGTQRVNNWKRRGIPPKVILQHPELFQPVETEKHAA